MKRTPATKARLRSAIVEEAHRQLGKPYVYGAWWQNAPREFDCSSLVQYLYKTVGIAIPRITIEQARKGQRVAPVRGRLKVGDLVFIRGRSGRYDRRFPQGIGHVYIVTGDDEVVHAKSRTARGKECGKVVIGKLSKVLARKDITVVRRIL